MSEDVRISYPNGSLVIHVRRFFPAPAGSVRKLYKVIELTERPDEVVEAILQYMVDRDDDLHHLIKETGNDWATSKTAYEETREQYRSRKMSNGMPIKKDQLPQWRKRIQALGKKWRASRDAFYMYMKERKKLAENRLLLLSLNGRC